MDRALDLKPEVTQGCGFEPWLWQEVSTTEVRPLSKAPNPQQLPGRRNVGCPLLHLDGLNAENTPHYTLYNCVCDKHTSGFLLRDHIACVWHGLTGLEVLEVD